MTLSVAPDRFKRYAGVARLIYKYVRRDLVAHEGALIEGFQKIANRITLGLLLASLIVGAALLMQVRTSFTILGYPGLAMIFFLLAAAGGTWLGVLILTGDRPPRHKPPAG